MRVALIFAALLLTAGFAFAPSSSAANCGGTVDIDCDASYCTIYAFNGIRPYCVYGENGHCIVYTSVTIASITTNALTCIPN